MLAVFELYTTFESYSTTSFHYFEYFVACCVWYLLLTTIWGFVQGGSSGGSPAEPPTSDAGGPNLRDRLFGVRADRDR